MICFRDRAKPGEPPHHQGVTGAHVFERGFEFRPVMMRAGRLLDVEPFAAGLFQGVDLQLGILIQGGDPRVADEHSIP